MHELTEEKIAFLENKAMEMRVDVVKMLAEAGSGHTAGPLGMADIFAALYFHILNHDPKHPKWEDRDRLVLSNGHICPILYAALANAGYFPRRELTTLRKTGSRLQGHPHRGSLPGVENTSGPLGLGLGQAAGMALSARMDGKKWHTYCLMSDAEQQEGATWESAMFAGANKLSNLTAIIDRNNIQISGYTEDVMPLEPLADKYRAFGWHVTEADGNNIADMVRVLNEANAIYEKPTVIIAYTISGKGVPWIEKDFNWHGKSPMREEAEKMIAAIMAGAKYDK